LNGNVPNIFLLKKPKEAKPTLFRFDFVSFKLNTKNGYRKYCLFHEQNHRRKQRSRWQQWCEMLITVLLQNLALAVLIGVIIMEAPLYMIVDKG